MIHDLETSATHSVHKIPKPGRILAIDYGTKGTGLAITDPYQCIAYPLVALSTREIKPFLLEYTKKASVVAMVLGLPKDLRGNRPPIAEDIMQFGAYLHRQYSPIPVYYHDERFTSKMAIQGLYQAGYNKKTRQDRGNIDKVSATIILQSFLNQRANDSGNKVP